MKKIILVLLLIVALLVGVSCKKNQEMTIKETDDGLVYDGTSVKIFTVAEEKKGIIEFSLNKKSGKFSMYVLSNDEKENVYYQGDNISSCNFKINLNDPIEYKVIIKAKKMLGKYELSFSEENC